jgi:nicotinamidase-related amidase
MRGFAGTGESMVLRDAPGFQILPELQPHPSEGVFDKLTMSAFEGTWLDFALRDCGINASIIVGVATEIGIEPTVRHGARSRLYSCARHRRLQRWQ